MMRHGSEGHGLKNYGISNLGMYTYTVGPEQYGHEAQFLHRMSD